MRIGVCLKLVDRRPEIDPLSGEVHPDPRSSGPSDADAAALEWALRAAEVWDGDVLVATVGAPPADGMLRGALALGARRAVRIELSDAPSEIVAAVLAHALVDRDVIWCGDYSLDRGSGSVPAFLAARLGAAQALGLVAIHLGEPGVISVLRRLDGGRRERLRAVAPAVLSVEGGTARLRRASPAASLATQSAVVEVRPGPPGEPHAPLATRPFRPRAHTLPAPSGTTRERILALTHALGVPAATAPLALSPPDAADRILDALCAWGYRARDDHRDPPPADRR